MSSLISNLLPPLALLSPLDTLWLWLVILFSSALHWYYYVNCWGQQHISRREMLPASDPKPNWATERSIVAQWTFSWARGRESGWNLRGRQLGLNNVEESIKKGFGWWTVAEQLQTLEVVHFIDKKERDKIHRVEPASKISIRRDRDIPSLKGLRFIWGSFNL